ncbi:MAG TPA: endonuclease/exonuclease/phosphatase family protein [Fimbriimonadaceae bacterium]|nr:endonuclease/exonuclease/phosphatase family protein [Fimbriimonadaceae bacterium]
MHRIREEIQKAGFWFWFWILSFLWVMTLYLWQPDFAFALTVYSPWVPAFIGLFGACVTSLKRRLRAVAAIALIWASWGAVASEEFHSLIRSTPGEADFRSFRFEGNRVRVVSLNCAGGMIEAANEVKVWQPDIVLLQESPGKVELEGLRKELFGKEGFLVAGPDASILSRYQLVSWHKGKREPMNYVGAALKFKGNQTWSIVSLRLQPPVLRFDYWNPACWSDYAEGKRKRARELQDLMNEVATFDDDWPMIVGGDFNAPPDRSIRVLMEPRVFDSARIAGKGWGMTAVSPLPLVRIDQIWMDPRLTPLRTISVHNSRSDHRMVVSDFLVPR